jgi:hypothetical protein
VNHVIASVAQLEKATRDDVIKRVLAEYPERVISVDERLVRLRKRPQDPSAANEYDSPPSRCRGGGRLDSEDFPVLYASQDIEVCVHECRVTVEDDLYMATLAPTRPLRCLDLTPVLEEEGCTEFESLDMAVHMLFLAQPHSYGICRAIAVATKNAGFAGLIYPVAPLEALLRPTSRAAAHSGRIRCLPHSQVIGVPPKTFVYVDICFPMMVFVELKNRRAPVLRSNQAASYEERIRECQQVRLI